MIALLGVGGSAHCSTLLGRGRGPGPRAHRVNLDAVPPPGARDDGRLDRSHGARAQASRSLTCHAIIAATARPSTGEHEREAARRGAPLTRSTGGGRSP